jgi:hypothetical protein
MTLLELIAKAAGLAGPELIAMLRKVAADLPDFAPLAEKWIAALNSALASENLIALGKDVVTELGQIAQGKVDGKPHPSDLG